MARKHAVDRIVTIALSGLLLTGCATDVDFAPDPDVQQPAPDVQQPAPVEEPDTPGPVDAPSPLADSGPRDGAMGAIELNANGTPWKYSVVEGDYATAICQRFNLASEQLVDEAGDAVDRHIYVGETLRFVPYRPVEQP